MGSQTFTVAAQAPRSGPCHDRKTCAGQARKSFRSQCEAYIGAWWARVGNYFKYYETTYVKETDKIAFVGHRMSGNAEEWYEARAAQLKQENKEDDWKSFSSEIARAKKPEENPWVQRSEGPQLSALGQQKDWEKERQRGSERQGIKREEGAMLQDEG